jgi:hypothetical protein
MSEVLTIDGREYILAGRVGKHFGYTRDYILMLAREGKIDGKKIGHRWYVNQDSVQTFFDTAKALREKRKIIVREERKEEFYAHQVQVRKMHAPSRRLEVLAIGMIAVVFLFAGTIQNLDVRASQAALSYASDAPLLEKIAVSIYNFLSPLEDTSTKTAPNFAVVDGSAAIQIQEDVSLVTHGEGTTTGVVIAPDTILTTTEIESVTDSFSDDVSVSVDPHNPNTGIVIPHFKEGDGEAYRFLLVPVTEAHTE